jgi:hypothetical protein
VSDEKPILVVGEPGVPMLWNASCGCLALAIVGVPFYGVIARSTKLPWPVFVPIELQILGGLAVIAVVALMLVRIAISRGTRVAVYQDRIDAEDSIGSYQLLYSDIEAYEELPSGTRIDTKRGRAWPSRSIWLEVSRDDRPRIAEVLEHHGIPRR